ncbi:hypothetical protein [Streptomyces sp. KN37]|nr:hypothetical protein [Streptomyces sp. KN37]WPO70818.1 hypothetical protein R9806_09355 [Streptomyces sp. KN37]
MTGHFFPGGISAPLPLKPCLITGALSLSPCRIAAPDIARISQVT